MKKLQLPSLSPQSNIAAFTPPVQSANSELIVEMQRRIETLEQSLTTYAPFVLQAASDTQTLNIVMQMLRKQYGNKFETKFSEAWRELYAPKPDESLVEELRRKNEEIATLKELLAQSKPVEGGSPD